MNTPTQPIYSGTPVPWPGAVDEITLRDYFAAAALQGILSDPASDGDSESFAVYAYTMADAMLAARKEGAK